MFSLQWQGEGRKIMRGDVWVEKNSKGDVVVCIDSGNGVSKKVIKKNVEVYSENNWETVKGKYEVKK
jgi:predicted acetyltransferase